MRNPNAEKGETQLPRIFSHSFPFLSSLSISVSVSSSSLPHRSAIRFSFPPGLIDFLLFVRSDFHVLISFLDLCFLLSFWAGFCHFYVSGWEIRLIWLQIVLETKCWGNQYFYKDMQKLHLIKHWRYTIWNRILNVTRTQNLFWLYRWLVGFWRFCCEVESEQKWITFCWFICDCYFIRWSFIEILSYCFAMYISVMVA